MDKKLKTKEFIDYCISTGKCVENSFNLSDEDILTIENILFRCSDSTARRKIRKIIDSNYFICDSCGSESYGLKHQIYDENFHKQEGLFQCEKCLTNQ